MIYDFNYGNFNSLRYICDKTEKSNKQTKRKHGTCVELTWCTCNILKSDRICTCITFIKIKMKNKNPNTMPDLPPIFSLFFQYTLVNFSQKIYFWWIIWWEKKFNMKIRIFRINIASTREVKFLFVNKVILLYVK